MRINGWWSARIQPPDSVRDIPNRDSLSALRDRLAASVGRFEGNPIAHLRRALIRRASRKFECLSCSKYDRGDVPRPQAPIDPDDGVAAPQENDIDREAHESPVLEQHPRSGLEAVATQQTSALTAETAGVLEPRAEHGPAGLIDCSQRRLPRRCRR